MDARASGSHRRRWLPSETFRYLLELVEPSIHFGFHLVLGIAIVFLKATLELRTAAFNDVKIVIGQLAPLALGLATNFFPFSFDLIPIHNRPPSSGPHGQHASTSMADLSLPHSNR